MAGQPVGYVRVSAFDQNTDRQLARIQVDRTFTDQASGKDVQRVQLAKMMQFIRVGDTVVVHSMDRLARNLDDRCRIVLSLTKRGVYQVYKRTPFFYGRRFSDGKFNVIRYGRLRRI